MTDIKLEDVKPFLGIPIAALSTWILTIWQQGKKSGAKEQLISSQIASIAEGQHEIRNLVADQQKQTRESIQRIHDRMDKMDDKFNERIDRVLQK